MAISRGYPFQHFSQEKCVSVPCRTSFVCPSFGWPPALLRQLFKQGPGSHPLPLRAALGRSASVRQGNVVDAADRRGPRRDKGVMQIANASSYAPDQGACTARRITLWARGSRVSRLSWTAPHEATGSEGARGSVGPTAPLETVAPREHRPHASLTRNTQRQNDLMRPTTAHSAAMGQPLAARRRAPGEPTS
jgi:hypothetical protein